MRHNIIDSQWQKSIIRFSPGCHYNQVIAAQITTPFLMRETCDDLHSIPLLIRMFPAVPKLMQILWHWFNAWKSITGPPYCFIIYHLTYCWCIYWKLLIFIFSYSKPQIRWKHSPFIVTDVIIFHPHAVGSTWTIMTVYSILILCMFVQLVQACTSHYYKALSVYENITVHRLLHITPCPHKLWSELYHLGIVECCGVWHV